jgi:predicted alpha/beta-fold hydrolase
MAVGFRLTKVHASRFGAEMVERIRIDVTPSEHVTAIAYSAADRDHAGISLILAHGAGANQTSSFMVHFATALAARGIDTVTFNFVYSEEARRVPDRNDKLQACWRKVIEAFRSGGLCQHADRRKLVIGGKSMGGASRRRLPGFPPPRWPVLLRRLYAAE